MEAIPNELDHISHSQINQWIGCPRRWEFKYVKHVQERQSDALLFGNVYHAVLEENFKAKMQLGIDLDMEIIDDVFDTKWNAAFSNAWDLKQGRYSVDTLKDMCASLLERYMEEVAPGIEPELVEHWFETYIDDTKFVLRMDIMDKNGVVIDHKTSARPYTQDKVDKDIQATATAFALGRPIVFYNHVAIKTSSPHIQLVKSYRTNVDIDWWLEKVKAIIAHMKSGYAPPNEESWLCSPLYCDYHDECRKGLYTSSII